MTKTAKNKTPHKPATRGKIKPAVSGEKALAPEKTVITILVDESGSMQPIAAATIGGFNEYVDTVSRDLRGQEVYFSAIKFDFLGVRKLQVGERIERAVRLSHENYKPNSMTPLYDAAAKTILATDDVVRKEGATKVIVVIQTDGAENASREYNLGQVRGMIEERQGRGWQFVFLGAGINAFEAGSAMGVAAMNTMSYGHDDGNTREMFAATANNTSSFSRGLSSSMNYSAHQSKAVGESHAILRQKMAAGGKLAVKPLLGPNNAVDIAIGVVTPPSDDYSLTGSAP